MSLEEIPSTPTSRVCTPMGTSSGVWGCPMSSDLRGITCSFHLPSEHQAAAGRRCGRGQPPAGDELTDCRAGGQHCGGRSPRSALPCTAAGASVGDPLLGMCGGRGGEIGLIATAISTQPHAQTSFNLVNRDAEKLQGMLSMFLGLSWQGHGDDLHVQHGSWQKDEASLAAGAVGVASPAPPCHHHDFESTHRLLVRAPEVLPH